MFTKYILNKQYDFDQLIKSVQFENVTNGRDGANIVDIKNDSIPIVRTVSRYHNPNQKFKQIHHDIIDDIKNVTNKDELQFNNGLVELYSTKYKTMGFHSDHTLDLDHDSYICAFSYYSDPQTQSLRKLVIKDKLTGETFNHVMDHNSIILFSVDVNLKYQHKIVLDGPDSNALWFGITFRQSKTFITFINEIPYFVSNKKQLTLANDEQKKEFYKCRGTENSIIDYAYPEFDFTLSDGDIAKIDF